MQPYFYSFKEFIAMGDHGVYVWSTWGLTFLIIIGFIVYSVSQRRRLLKELDIQHTRQKQRKQTPQK